jgi:hypothetical protein
MSRFFSCAAHGSPLRARGTALWSPSDDVTYTRDGLFLFLYYYAIANAC